MFLNLASLSNRMACEAVNGRRGKWLLLIAASLVFSMLLLVTMTAHAQSGRRVPPRPAPDSPVVRVETAEILLPLNAYDADGRNVTDLTPKDLVVVEDGRAREIVSLRREPASIVLVLDLANEFVPFKNASSHWYTDPVEKGMTAEERQKRPVWMPKRRHDFIPVPGAREFAERFVSGLAEGDQIAILQYSDLVELVQDWTGDRGEAIHSLRSKYRVGQQSRYYEALGQAAAKLEGRPGRKVIVLLSDGVNSAGQGNRRNALEAVAHTGAAVFAVEWREVLRRAKYDDATRMNEEEREKLEAMPSIIGFLFDLFFGRGKGSSDPSYYIEWPHSVFEQGSRELHALADNGSGEVLLPRNFNELAALPVRLQRDIQSQYSLLFIAERGSGAGTKREIDVIPARPGMSVRVRQNYYIGAGGQ